MTSRADRARELINATATVADWQARFEKYGTTLHNCQCPDAQYRRQTCKHVRALRMLSLREGKSKVEALDAARERRRARRLAEVLAGLDGDSSPSG